MTEGSQLNHRRLTLYILLGLILGGIVGGLMNVAMHWGLLDRAWMEPYVIEGVLDTVGSIFIHLLTMLIIPIVLVSLVSGVASLADPKSLGRVGGKAVGMYLLTTGIAITVALGAGQVFGLFEPGEVREGADFEPAEAPSLGEVLVNMVPANPVQAMSEGNILGLIVFSILLGLAMTLAGKSGQRMAGWFSDAMEVVMKLVGLVMVVAPVGVFALIAEMAATTEGGAFIGLLGYVFLVLGVLIFHALVVYPSLLRLFTGLSVVTFYWKLRDVLAFAFSTASSGATIPITLRTVERRLGASNRVSSLVVPLGATVNMDGTAIMQGVAVGFIAHLYGVDLSLTQYLMIVLMVVLSSIGTAGVPGAGLILLAGVLAQVGLPNEAIGIILGVDRILDMTRTAVNVTGDATITTIVAKSEGELDVDRFKDTSPEPIDLPEAEHEPKPAADEQASQAKPVEQGKH